ncbi:MAG: hypothetical protein CBE24_03650 [bacterium TMED264]|nr:MAG: hypothetical protein CBE24_03650 [bacterium TMED264]|tara:strand:- start:177 stop:1328 length:1152 start_codon:yes stop_codon:yes gene_type:complete
MATEEITNQEEVLEESEQEELVEAPEQEEQLEIELSEKSKSEAAHEDDEDDDDEDEEEEEEQVKKEEVKVPSTKSAMIKALFDKVNGMKKEEVTAKWKDLMGVAEAEDMGGPTPMDSDPKKDEVGKKKKKMKVAMPEINVKEDIDALVEGEQLSEEFKSKASTIFEAAVHQKVMEIATVKVEELEKEFQSDLQEEIISFRDELTEKVDGYLNYVVEEWMRENELALENSLRSEITEEFMGGLKNLFTEHYIDVPDEKVDIVESLYDKVEELEGQLNTQIEENVKTKDELNEYRKNKILEEVCSDLADTQSEKMKSLVEGVSYEENAEDFESKIKTIKESYFPNQVKQDENIDQKDVVSEDSPSEETPKMNNIMEAYSKAISRK